MAKSIRFEDLAVYAGPPMRIIPKGPAVFDGLARTTSRTGVNIKIKLLHRQSVPNSFAGDSPTNQISLSNQITLSRYAAISPAQHRTPG